jgi:hypothetical protein
VYLPYQVEDFHPGGLRSDLLPIYLGALGVFIFLSLKHQKKLAQVKVRREAKETVFGEDFQQAIVQFLNFDQRYHLLVEQLSKLVKEHAVPVGSGTVARSSSVTLDDKAALAVMAWMRHQTSAYDSTSVARVKGARRELRRQIAHQSERILAKYRSGDDVDYKVCPLYRALYA